MTATHARNGASRMAHIEAALRHLIRAADDFIQGDGSRVEVDLDYCAALSDLERAVERAQGVWARHRRGASDAGARPHEKAPCVPNARKPADADQHPRTTAARPETHVPTPRGTDLCLKSSSWTTTN